LTPHVSVIVPTFNRANLITQTINSALDQPDLELEVIVIDDGSTDETEKVVEGIHDSRLLYIYQHNQGKGAAINRGVEASRGKYIGKLDSDDWYLPSVLPDLVSQLERFPELGVAAGGYQIVDNSSQPLEEVYPWLTRPELDLKTWIKSCPVLWQAALVRREWFEKVGGVDPKISGPDDWDFGIRLASSGCKMAWVKKIIFNYRLHAGTSIKSDQSYSEQVMAILDRCFSDPSIQSETKSEKNAAYYQANINCAGREYAAGNYEQAKRSFSFAIQLDPGLLEEDGKRLFFTIAWWARSPLITRQPENFVRSVIANLPEEAAKFQTRVHKALAEMYAVQFYRAYEAEDWLSVQQLGQKIIKNDPTRLFDRGVLSVGFRAIFSPELNKIIRNLFYTE
jgi:GT2 family glycosyltransferase